MIFLHKSATLIHMNRSFVLSALSCFLLSGCLGSSGYAPAPVTSYGASGGEGSSGVHIVRGGDTLWSISKRYDIAMNEIVYTNEMSAPFMLGAGQRLKLPPPNNYRVRSGDSLYSISRLFDISISDIARMNNMNAPYTIQPGQELRLPSHSGVKAPTYKQAALQKPASLSPDASPVEREVLSSPSTTNPIQRPELAKPPARSSAQFMQPVNGRIVSRYGPKDGGLHNDGINIEAPRGANVGAAENGVVVYAGSELKGYGNLVLVRHDGGYVTAYAHMDDIRVSKGQVLRRGETVGTVGSTGFVSSPQLHFEVRRGTKAIDPQRYLS